MPAERKPFFPARMLREATLAHRAAPRIRAALQKAEDGNYLQHAWYSHIDRHDLEAVLAFAEAAVGGRRAD